MFDGVKSKVGGQVDVAGEPSGAGVGGVAIETVTPSVIATGGAGIGVAVGPAVL
jgi:hypothetical protein